MHPHPYCHHANASKSMRAPLDAFSTACISITLSWLVEPLVQWKGLWRYLVLTVQVHTNRTYHPRSLQASCTGCMPSSYQLESIDRYKIVSFPLILEWQRFHSKMRGNEREWDQVYEVQLEHVAPTTVVKFLWPNMYTQMFRVMHVHC